MLYNFAMKIRQSLLSGICGLILFLLPLTFSTSPAARRSKSRTPQATQGSEGCNNDKSIPIEKRVACTVFYKNLKTSDPNNHPVQKKVRLYSRASRLHVQITKTEVDARGQNDSEHAILVLESDNFGRLKIRSHKTNRYLCMNKQGNLVTKVKKYKFVEIKAKKCIFKEKDTGDGYIQFQSVKYPQWYIGFSKHGRPTNAIKGAKRQKPRYRQFLKKIWPEKRKRQQSRRSIQFSQLKKKIIRLLRMKLRL